MIHADVNYAAVKRPVETAYSDRRDGRSQVTRRIERLLGEAIVFGQFATCARNGVGNRQHHQLR
jgi:hypothetical protein